MRFGILAYAKAIDVARVCQRQLRFLLCILYTGTLGMKIQTAVLSEFWLYKATT